MRARVDRHRPDSPAIAPGRPLGAEHERLEILAALTTTALGLSAVLFAVAVLATQATGDVPAGLALFAAALAVAGLAMTAADLRTPPA